MVGWYHQLDGHEFDQAPGVGDGQGSLACCNPQGRKESDTTEQLNKNKNEVGLRARSKMFLILKQYKLKQEKQTVT